MRKRKVAVTGIGITLPNCDSTEVFWRHLETGTSQLAEVPDPSDSEQTVLAGRVNQSAADRRLAEVPEQHLEHYSREVRCYLSSVLAARSDAGLRNARLAGDRVGIYDGSSRGAVEFWDSKIRRESGGKAGGFYSRKDILNAINGQTVGIAAALFGTTGPALAVAGSCAAGLIATAQACRDIEDGRIDIAFATGHDLALTPALFAMYSEAGLLRRGADSPDASCGDGLLAFSEGAATVVLEERESALARGARVLARVTGHGYCNEGKNPFTVDKTGESQARLIGSVLDSAGAAAGDIDFVVGHGNGLRDCDQSERNYMRILFGDNSERVAFVSTKVVFGHTLGGSGSVNLAAAAMMLDRGRILPTYNGTTPTAAPPAQGDKVRDDTPVSRGIVFTCGMGGLMCACLLEREEAQA